MSITIDLGKLYESTAKLSKVESYIQKVMEHNINGQEITLTGQAPIWLYLKIAHALHGKAAKLWYNSPVTGPVLIFDHDPH